MEPSKIHLARKISKLECQELPNCVTSSRVRVPTEPSISSNSVFDSTNTIKRCMTNVCYNKKITNQDDNPSLVNLNEVMINFDPSLKEKSGDVKKLALLTNQTTIVGEHWEFIKRIFHVKIMMDKIFEKFNSGKQMAIMSLIYSIILIADLTISCLAFVLYVSDNDLIVFSGFLLICMVFEIIGLVLLIYAIITILRKQHITKDFAFCAFGVRVAIFCIGLITGIVKIGRAHV